MWAMVWSCMCVVSSPKSALQPVSCGQARAVSAEGDQSGPRRAAAPVQLRCLLSLRCWPRSACSPVGTHRLCAHAPRGSLQSALSILPQGRARPVHKMLFITLKQPARMRLLGMVPADLLCPCSYPQEGLLSTPTGPHLLSTEIKRLGFSQVPAAWMWEHGCHMSPRGLWPASWA